VEVEAQLLDLAGPVGARDALFAFHQLLEERPEDPKPPRDDEDDELPHEEPERLEERLEENVPLERLEVEVGVR
jgi:hypothetical protein